MVDPASVAVGIGAANAGTSLAINAGKGAKSAFKRWRLLGTFEPEWLSLGGDDDTGLTSNQVKDIESFLAAPSLEPLLAFLAITKLSLPSAERDEALAQFRSLFGNEVRRWTTEKRTDWIQHATWLTRRIEGIYDGTIGPSVVQSVATADLEQFGDFVNSPALSGARAESSSTTYLGRLIQLISNLDQLAHALDLSRRIAQTIGSANHLPIITHTELDDKSEFESLYVSRRFVRLDDEQSVDSNTLNPSTDPFRMVVMGDPGAGKSTFVQHMKKQISSIQPHIPVIEIVCRHYSKSAWAESLLEHAADIVNAEYSISISARDLEHMLLLGRVCLVFDGLDEITDQIRRAKMIARIESLVVQYPSCSVLATTRLLGYERAPMRNPLFVHVRLDQFDEEQFSEYCTRWFRLKGREDLIESFIDDSSSVEDLRSNPLMLSLLCALYREHGSLPTDRRDVYARCADLLFRRWDSHRQIEHDGAMPKYAERLMQEIARWVYSSPSVQDGIEEQILVKILAHSLRDRDGFELADAERDAQSFVNFCAGRAWLLASFGTNSHGQRVFRFTHRTFLEYFAAESFVRKAKDDSDVCHEIVETFTRDATSVVPELLIQAYDFRRDGGGAAVFLELLRSGAQNVLLLRLMEGIGMSATMRRRVLVKTFRTWLDGDISDYEFDLVLGLNPQARSQLVKEFIENPSEDVEGINLPRIHQVLVDGWAGRVLSGSTARHFEYWNPVMIGVVERGTSPSSPVGANWSVAADIDPVGYSWSGWDAVVSPSLYGAVPGVIWWTIDARFGRGEAIPESPLRRRVIMTVYKLLSRGAQVPAPLIEDLRLAILYNGAEHLDWTCPDLTDSDPLDETLLILLFHLVCTLHEARCDTEAFIQILNTLQIDDIRPALEWRDYRVKTGRRPSADRQALAMQFMGRQPQWLKSWFDGRRSFVMFTDD
ncbi:NACHT domain-containing NTPase [Nocardia sp. 348MFTsu5.1]|uniref:NACHT domain-containing protein n=1 Tax=Nocardia sp. 348MFTsu5.1 TaxID=1172185 RepID=UPI00036B1B24|nr:NACHT domain-containing protein [Nocardia sp. 348MFTsu5.1]